MYAVRIGRQTHTNLKHIQRKEKKNENKETEGLGTSSQDLGVLEALGIGRRTHRNLKHIKRKEKIMNIRKLKD